MGTNLVSNHLVVLFSTIIPWLWRPERGSTVTALTITCSTYSTLKCDHGWWSHPLTFWNVTLWSAPENRTHINTFIAVCCPAKIYSSFYDVPLFKCRVRCAARGNVHSCGTSRAHSSCDGQDTLLWGHSLGHPALIRTPSLPWLMSSLVSCDNPYPLSSLEDTWISETTTQQYPLKSIWKRNEMKHLCNTVVSGHWHELKIGFHSKASVWQFGCNNLKKRETDEGNWRSWEKITSDDARTNPQDEHKRCTGDEKM